MFRGYSKYGKQQLKEARQVLVSTMLQVEYILAEIYNNNLIKFKKWKHF